MSSVNTAWQEVTATLWPRPNSRDGPLPPLLLTLTVVTGLVDAASYLKLGHVFVANMTGNVTRCARLVPRRRARRRPNRRSLRRAPRPTGLLRGRSGGPRRRDGRPRRREQAVRADRVACVRDGHS